MTVIGAAAHVMPPFLGADMAMLDAVELVDHLCSDRSDSLIDALTAYEHGMRERMVPFIERSVGAQEVLFNVEAPKALAAMINTARADIGEIHQATFEHSLAGVERADLTGVQ